MKTRAAVFHEPGEPLAIEELDLDEPKAGEVRVRMAAVGLCRSDHNVLAGTRPVAMTPMVLGHEGAGVVEAVGPGVTRVAEGDHVVLMFIPTCGECDNCAAGRTHSCVLSARIPLGPQLDDTYRLRDTEGRDVGQFCLIGGFSEHVVVPELSVCVIDDHHPLEVACLVGCGVVGAYGAVVNRARVTTGSSVLVIGVGGVGMNAVQSARIAGADVVIAADIVDRKLEWAREFGATHTIDATTEDVVARVMEITGGSGVDFAFEAISRPETIGQAFEATGRLGTITVIGLTPSRYDGIPVSPLGLVLAQKTVMGTLYGTSNALVEIPSVLAMYDEGRFKLDELVTSTYSLDEVNRGYEDMVAGKNIRGVITFG